LQRRGIANLRRKTMPKKTKSVESKLRSENLQLLWENSILRKSLLLAHDHIKTAEKVINYAVGNKRR
jgi:hypothetical protein